MAGFLDALLGSTPEQTQALGLLGATMASGGGFGQGAANAMQYLSGADQRRLQRGLLEAQLAETQAQAEERRAKLAAMKRQQDLISSIFGPQGMSAPQVSPGAFQPSPSEAGPMGPTMPQSMAGMAAPGSRIGGLGIDQLAALKMAGVDLTDIHKYANDPLKLEGGSTYRDRTTGTERYIPRLPEGFAPLGGGSYGPLPGLVQGKAALSGAETGAQEAAKAQFDLVRIVGPDGAERYVPRSMVVGGGQPPPAQPRPSTSQRFNPADADRYAILTQELEKARQAGNMGDMRAVQAEIDRLPAAARTTPSPSGLAVAGGGFQATPTTAQSAAAKAAETKAVEQAKADVKPTEQRKAALDSANYMYNLLGMALKHPGRETATGLSGSIDPRNYLPGTNAKNFQVLLDQIKGSAFLQAFESLKGGGQITQVEGEKATNAIARLQTAQSDDEFKSALEEFRGVIGKAIQRMGADAPASSTGGATGGWGIKRVN